MKIEPRKGMVIEDTNDNLHELECGCTCGCGNPFLVFTDYCFKNDRLLKQILVCKNCGNIITIETEV